MTEEMKDNVTVLKVEDSKVSEKDIKSGEDTSVEDLRVITKMINEAKDLLPGLSRDDFIKFLNNLLFKIAVRDLKYDVPQIILDGTVAETTEEKIENLLGHAGYIASKSPIDNKYNVNVTLGDDVVVIRDSVKATALIRAVLTRYKRTIYKRYDIEETFINLWLKINKLTIKDDPRRLTEEDLETRKTKIKEATGLDIDQLENELSADADGLQSKMEENYEAFKSVK